MNRIFVIAFMLLMLFSCGEKRTKALISTNLGDITIELYDETPQHRDNFVKLANDGFYNETLFHRVIKEFMIQGGDPDSKGAAPGVRLGSGGPGYTVPAEILPQFFHKKGAVAAARLGDGANPEKNSSGCQFYIVHGKAFSDSELDRMKNLNEERTKTYKEIGGTPFLDDNYTVFGEVVSGMDVLDKIAAVQTQPGDRPVEDVKMTVSIVK